MLDITFILENKDLVRGVIENKRGEMVDFNRLESLYTERNELVRKSNELNHQRKIAAENRNIEQGVALKQEIATLEEKLRAVTKELTAIIASIPNIPSPDVPVGKDENDNVVLRQWGEKPAFAFEPKPHWDLGKEREFIDTERAAKVAGSRFAYLRGALVRLQFALIQWILSVVTDGETLKEITAENNLGVPTVPFTPVIPPVMITPEMFYGMARLEPKEDRYFLPDDNLFLIGSGGAHARCDACQRTIHGERSAAQIHRLLNRVQERSRFLRQRHERHPPSAPV